MRTKGILRYILKRLLIAIPVLLGITFLDFLIMNLAGNPLAMLMGPRVSQGAVEARALELGLDQPLLIRYGVWLGQVLQGNLGYSIKSFEPVAGMIRQQLGPTLMLMGSSLVLSLLIAIPAGIYSAVKQYSVGDYIIVGFSFLSISVPSFFLALVFIYLFSSQLGWLPSSGMYTLGSDRAWADVAKHMVMPVLVMTASLVGNNIRYIRSGMLEILQANYLRTAKAKGIGQTKVIGKHAFRNALITIVTVIGMQIPMLFGGSIIIEQVFAWPGLGLMTMSAILARDYPVIMGTALLAAVVVQLANLVTDIVYVLIDPTISLE